MKKTVQQTIEFLGVSVEELFQTYLTSRSHAAAIGAPARMSKKVNGKFSVFGKDGIKGKNLLVLPNQMVVQTWRGQDWKSKDLDSILVLSFEKTSKGARLSLLQTNIPVQAYKMVNVAGWNQMYWRPWKRYFTGKKRRK